MSEGDADADDVGPAGVGGFDGVDGNIDVEMKLKWLQLILMLLKLIKELMFLLPLMWMWLMVANMLPTSWEVLLT